MLSQDASKGVTVPSPASVLGVQVEDGVTIHVRRYDVPYVGSLEFLTGQARLAEWPDLAERVEDDEAAPLPPPMDLVIMNPPFTRDRTHKSPSPSRCCPSTLFRRGIHGVGGENTEARSRHPCVGAAIRGPDCGGQFGTATVSRPAVSHRDYRQLP